ncbi:MAG: NAD(P)/FAD-dependent oxidoreductase [Methylococcales bacterium]|nr:NAD(P)/FAD-dependent oxidoreductase [Methylococcales bacterium]
MVLSPDIQPAFIAQSAVTRVTPGYGGLAGLSLNSIARHDVVIVGAGASGLMCAIESAKRGRRVLVMDHAARAGRKILMSGGGRCNFTNYRIDAENYISHNPHFCKSALRRFTQWDFLALVEKYRIPYHERLHGQLFCNDSAKDILDMLLAECRLHGVQILLGCTLNQLRRLDDGDFELQTSKGVFHCQSLVVASGGLSIPKMGASPLGYKIAEQFGINIRPTRPGLAPFTLQPQDKDTLAPLAGIAVPCIVGAGSHAFRENLLFTHRGLSGPAILQISSYWRPGELLNIDLLPDVDILQFLKQQRAVGCKLKLQTLLAEYLPKRLLHALLEDAWLSMAVADCADRRLQDVAERLHGWRIKPGGTEGYRTAEVTLGGVDCDALSSKTMECLTAPGLFFVGEVLDVSGWLGGYNFQWAWSSGWCAGQYT